MECYSIFVEYIPGEPWALIIGRRDAFLVGFSVRLRTERLWEYCLSLG